MTPANPAVEPISSDPVIIDTPEIQEKTQEPTTTDPAVDSKLAETSSYLVDSVANIDLETRHTIHRPVRVVRQRRNYSPPPHISSAYEVPSLINTKILNDLLNEPDTCADTINGHLVYISNTPFHAVDLENISWVFRSGNHDAWVQKPASHLPSHFDLPHGGRGRRNGYIDYEDRYDDFEMPRGRGTPIVRLGHALKIFRSDEKHDGTEKVKFVVVVQGRESAGWWKLVVCYSRQALMVEIFHEILNQHSIAFVGAVLMDVMVPLEAGSRKQVKFKRVGSLNEAEELGEGVVGVIC